MPRQQANSIENNFVKGLLTEHTGLNFPENACTETFNCIFDRTGKVSRRKGFNYEANLASEQIDRPGNAINTFKWNNPGGEGNTRVLVLQVGSLLHFYRPSSATVTVPLSLTKLQSTVNLTSFELDAPFSFPPALTEECEFAEGNGYLFVFHPYLEPFFCTYTAGVIVAERITVKIRDFEGIIEPGVDDTFRSETLSQFHKYNLANQGWSKNYKATASGTGTVPASSGSTTFNVDSHDYPIAVGDRVQLYTAIVQGQGPVSPLPGSLSIFGTVQNYTELGNGTADVQIKITGSAGSGSAALWTLIPEPPSIEIWFRDIGNFPSNSDIWWLYKNASGVYSPASTANNVTVNAGPAPKGSFILEAFRQVRSEVSGVLGLTDIIATALPKTGAWFQGRVWYAGVNSATFTENVYFSQTIENTTQFGKCYQVNDPTSEERFDLFPTDGGVIRIQGAGTIHKLVPVQNGVLVFAAAGVWFISGSQGVGFAANDYTVIKLASIATLSSSSFITVEGNPFWWNEDGIWAIVSGNSGGYSATSVTNDTIAEFFSQIPLHSKRIARGDYNPLTQTIQWCYRSTGESDRTNQYGFDRILNLNTGTKSFYPWTMQNNAPFPSIHGINYIEGSVGINNPSRSAFKYLTSVGSPAFFTFSEERDDETYTDWVLASLPADYSSYFITGYKIHGQMQRKFQSNYVYLYVDNEIPGEFFIRGLWDYSVSPSSGRWSVPEKFTYLSSNFSHRVKRVKIRGQGLALQFKVESSSTKPFDLIGWSSWETSNAGI